MMTARASSWCSLRGVGRRRRGDRRGAKRCRRFCSHKARLPPTNELTRTANADHAEYRGPASFPNRSGVPLPARCCCRAARCRSIFSSRAIWRCDDALRDGHRLIGMMPAGLSTAGTRQGRSCSCRLRRRITQLAESATAATSGTDRRRALQVVEEISALTAYRQCKVDFFPYADDFVARRGEEPSTAPRCSTC